jgi:hypothetical protein
LFDPLFLVALLKLVSFEKNNKAATFLTRGSVFHSQRDDHRSLRRESLLQSRYGCFELSPCLLMANRGLGIARKKSPQTTGDCTLPSVLKDLLEGFDTIECNPRFHQSFLCHSLLQKTQSQQLGEVSHTVPL